ncbi:pyridoxamine 5'-phosphate oxidase [bacterium BMS3Abin03]|nr:pyridoxamine 5'-phosphate oxidase [bacterium BMS3Abin03]
MNRNNKKETEEKRIIKELSEDDVLSNPFEQFNVWFDEAKQSEIVEPTAAILSTVGEDNHPSARTILLKEVNEKGFVFYTNYESKKANDIASNPNISLLFLWKEQQRQVRIVGQSEKISREESEKYFRTRPRESQIGAWASHQSSVIPDRKSLDNKFEEYRKKFGDKEIPLPDFWGGYVIIPNYFEFWQGRPGRLHDRICYKFEDQEWRIFRLAP